MRERFARAAVLCALFAATPLAAQQDVARQSYLFLGRSLTIDVVSPIAGELHVVRGGGSRLEIAGRAIDGFVVSGLAERAGDRLRLVAVGSDRVEYVVVVPENVRVRVNLPGRHLSESLGGRQPVATYEWGAESAPVARRDETDSEGLHRLYLTGSAPAELALPDTRLVGKVTVRIAEGDWFEVLGTRPMRLEGSPGRVLEIRPCGQPVDLVVLVPRRAAGFALRVGDRIAMTVADGVASVHCSPVIDQKLDGDRRWLTFTPSGRDLECSPSIRA